MKERRHNAGGFTLTELVIVMAIIVTLSAILMPALMRAKIEADSAACKSNLRQLGMALLMYTGDFDGRVPTSSVLDESKCWVSIMQPYYVERDVMLCPRDESPYALETLDPVIRGSYGYNIDIGWSGRKISDFRKPSRILVFADAITPHLDKNKCIAMGEGSGTMDLDKEWAAADRHNVNFLALDGHVGSRIYIGADDPLFTEAEE
jgi:prepilin-type N-terminal cleavage/methylation domain-containing protein